MSCNDNKQDIETENFTGYMRAGFIEVLGHIENLTDKDNITKVRVRYKPREVTAVYVSAEHIVRIAPSHKVVKHAGWFIPGPNKTVFYVPEEKFKQFFEIVSEE